MMPTLPALCMVHDELGEEVAAEHGTYLCAACAQRLVNALEDIHNDYVRVLDLYFLAGTKEPRTANTKSVPPMSMHVVSLTDARSVYERPGDPVSAERVLGAWCQAVADTRGRALPVGVSRDVRQQCCYLITALGWLVTTPVVARFAHHVMCTRRSLATVLR